MLPILLTFLYTQKHSRCGQAWWVTLVILSLKRLRQWDYEYKASQDSIVRLCFKQSKPLKHDSVGGRAVGK